MTDDHEVQRAIGDIVDVLMEAGDKGRTADFSEVAIAGRHGCELDIHLHDRGDLGAVTVEMIAERTRALGLKGRVALSHAFCLGMVEPARLDGLIDLLLGRVKRFENREISGEAIVEPAVDFSTLDYVFVIEMQAAAPEPPAAEPAKAKP